MDIDKYILLVRASILVSFMIIGTQLSIAGADTYIFVDVNTNI